MSEQTTEAPRRRKGRSPSYPGIDLEEAIDKAAVLYEKEGQHPVHNEEITTHWGYKPNTGPGLVAIAALKKFGLLEEVENGKSRRARLTPLALSILLHERGSMDRQRRIRDAALMPPIHTELLNQFAGRLPSDQSLRRVLVLDRGFTESGAQQFIRQFKSTMAFATIGTPDKLPDVEPSHYREHVGVVAHAQSEAVDHLRTEGSAQLSTRREGQPEVRTFPLPVSMPIWPELRVPYPMTEEAWEQMMFLIQASKAGVVKQAATDSDQQASDSATVQSEASDPPQ